MKHGAAPLTEQSIWFFRMPLGQQSLLVKPGTEPHPAPPQRPHPSGQHTFSPRSLAPSMPTRPLVQVSPG